MPCLDAFERPIEYLRVSVTDRCNLRCTYCMPEEGVKFIPHTSILRYEEIVRIVRVAVGMGMTHIRLTGGEPLVRTDIVELVRQLAAIPGLDDLSMTTNGILLERYAGPLAEAGLKRVNLSLDTLRPDRLPPHHPPGHAGEGAARARGGAEGGAEAGEDQRRRRARP